MVAQLYTMPINDIDTLPERFERKYYPNTTPGRIRVRTSPPDLCYGQ